MSALASLSTCLICGQTFTGPSALIIGEKTKSAERTIAMLTEHLGKAHPEHVKAMHIKGLEFVGLMYLMNFKTSDEELTAERDRLRWQIHQKTLKARYPDENLKAQAEALAHKLQQDLAELSIHHDYAIPDTAMHASFAAILIEAFTGIRDALEEPGKYPAPSVVQPAAH